MRKVLLGLAISSALLMTTTSSMAACDPGEIVIKFSHVTNTDKHPKGIAATLLEKRVNEEMNGKACMEVFPNSTLYDDNKVLEAMLNGDVQLAAPSLSKFEKFTKKFRIFDLPFIFKDVNAVDKFQNSPDGEKLKGSMKRRGLLGLAFWHNGMKQMSANRPLILPADAKGLKFRVQASDVLVAQFEQLDASPQKMSFKEVYGGLEQGVIDGQENTWSNIYSKKFHEVQKYITETNHGYLGYMVVTNQQFWNHLPKDVRMELESILSEVTAWVRENALKINMDQKAKVIAAGTTKVTELTEAEKGAFREAFKPVHNQFRDVIGGDLIDAVYELNAKN